MKYLTTAVLPAFLATCGVNAQINYELVQRAESEFKSVCQSPRLHGQTVTWGSSTYKYHCGSVGPWDPNERIVNAYQPSHCAEKCEQKTGCTGFLWLYQGSFCYLGLNRLVPIGPSEQSTNYLYMELLSSDVTDGGTGEGIDEGIDQGTGEGTEPEPNPDSCAEKCLQAVPECRAAEQSCKESDQNCKEAEERYKEATEECRKSQEAYELYEKDQKRWNDAMTALEGKNKICEQDKVNLGNTNQRLQETVDTLTRKLDQCNKDMDNTKAICPDNRGKTVKENGRKFTIACGKWHGVSAYDATKRAKGYSFQECLEKCAPDESCTTVTYNSKYKLCFFSSRTSAPAEAQEIMETAWTTS
ncbi:hypothetical protein BDV33DRAFT_208720 [Aspergillus novoparasiticus]|uniref:Apple domain-containing protein n=1 Tax=Aspergillus novoparasiticus TaxID=986946 RepID=A0A5N6EF80_9EURO|nr:hypothetical protein BDV33DRAFT_208720 [Aspergillus novoparasiticus]